MIKALALLIAIHNPSVQTLVFSVVPVKWSRHGDPIRHRLRVFDSNGVKLSRVFDHVSSPTFDHKRRELAFAEGFTAYIWSAGKGLRRFPLPKLPNDFGEGVYFKNGFVWSPDSARLMVWEPSTQGDADWKVGHLFVLHPATGKWRSIAGGASGIKWLNHRWIEYRQIVVDDRVVMYNKVHRLDVVDPKSKPIFSHIEMSD